jgi:flavin-binding protein dodecin
MSEHIYKTIELTGSSQQNFEQAIERAISRANATIRNIRWFQVIEMRGQVDGGKVAHWQVTLKVGFTLDGATPA